MRRSTPKTDAVEREVAAILDRHLGPRHVLLGRYFVADLQAVNKDGTIRHIVEVKQRKNPSSAYDTYMISAKKVLGLRWLAEELGVPVFLAVDFMDGLMLCRLERGIYTLSVGGRSDRGLERDIETMAVIPMHLFTEVA